MVNTHPHTRTSKLLWVILLLLVFHLTARGENGASLVSHQLTPLYDAAVAVLGEPRAREFFRHWTPEITEFAAYRMRRFLKDLADTSDVQHRAQLFRSYQRLVKGTLGEAQGLALLWSAYQASPSRRAGAKMLDDIQYRADNPTGHRPDGILYRIEDGRLYIVQILEGKIGTSYFKLTQFRSYVEQWQKEGIVIQGEFFPPSHIFLGDSTKALQKVSWQDVLQSHVSVAITGLNGHAQPTYKILPITLSQDELGDIVTTLTADKLTRDDAATLRDHVAEASRNYLAERRRAINDWVRKNRRLPRSEVVGKSAEELAEQRLGTWILNQRDPDGSGYTYVYNDLLDEDNRQLFDVRMRVEPEKVLNEWIHKHKRFPFNHPDKTTEEGRQEASLAGWINTHGRQAGVFRDHLDDESRAVFDVRLNVEPRRLMNDWVRKNRRLPGVVAHPKNEDQRNERRLAIWMTANGRASEIVRRILEPDNRRLFAVQAAVHPKRLIRTLPETDPRRLELRLKIEPLRVVNEWIWKHKSFPSMTASQHSPEGREERRIASWIKNRKGGKADRKYIFHHDLDERNRRLFQVRMDSEPEVVLNEWIRAHERFPSLSTTDKEEKQLVTWLSKQGTRDVVFRKLLDPENREFFDVRFEAEPERLANDWIREHKRFPYNHRSSLQRTLEEKREARLASWISRQGTRYQLSGQAYFYKHMLDRDLRSLFEVRMSVEPEKVFNEWARANGRFPSQSNRHKTEAGRIERRLARWVVSNGGILNVLDTVVDKLTFTVLRREEKKRLRAGVVYTGLGKSRKCWENYIGILGIIPP